MLSFMCCKHTSQGSILWNGGCCLPLWWPGVSVWAEEAAAWSVSRAGGRPWMLNVCGTAEQPVTPRNFGVQS